MSSDSSDSGGENNARINEGPADSPQAIVTQPSDKPVLRDWNDDLCECYKDPLNCEFLWVLHPRRTEPSNRLIILIVMAEEIKWTLFDNSPEINPAFILKLALERLITLACRTTMNSILIGFLVPKIKPNLQSLSLVLWFCSRFILAEGSTTCHIKLGPCWFNVFCVLESRIKPFNGVVRVTVLCLKVSLWVSVRCARVAWSSADTVKIPSSDASRAWLSWLSPLDTAREIASRWVSYHRGTCRLLIMSSNLNYNT